MKEILIAFVHVFAMMAPWLVFGFLMAGIIAVWIPRSWVNRMMGGSSGFRGILRAVAIGVPLPICSCGVLPIAAGLRKHGAGKGPTAALLISTPQTGIDSILATYALLGPVFAVARPIAAAFTGVLGGAVVSAVGGEDASTVAVEESAAGSRGIKAIFWQAYRRLLGSVAKPLAVGLAVSAFVTVLVPDNFFADAFHGSDWIAMPVMALVGFPMYVCSTASIPIAASLVAKGVSPGAAFVFLMVGPAMNAMSLTTVAALVGRKAAAAYVAVIVIGAILCGIAINFVPDALPEASAIVSAGHSLSVVHWTCAAFLAAMIAYNLVRPVGMGHSKCSAHLAADNMAGKQDSLIGRMFRHFKGNLYRLEGFAKDSETQEEMVVYRALYGEGGLWVRPAKMFFETVERGGKTMKRFELVEDAR